MIYLYYWRVGVRSDGTYLVLIKSKRFSNQLKKIKTFIQFGLINNSTLKIELLSITIKYRFFFVK